MNNRWTEMEHLKQDYLSIQPPETGLWEVRKRMKQAEAVLKQQRRMALRARWAVGAAAALALFVATPNLSPAAAAYLSEIPVLAPIIRVVTLDRWQFADETHQADVKTPALESDSSAARQVNEDAEAYTDKLVGQFKAYVAENGGDYKALDVDYAPVTDTDDWFTLKITAVETEASGYTYTRYYNIDKATGKVVSLADLFQPGADYVTALSEDIKAQMRARMAASPDQSYFLDSEEDPDQDFQQIHPDQSFYKNSEGDLVISFDEYEVAPGYMGPQEFTIEQSAISHFLR